MIGPKPVCRECKHYDYRYARGWRCKAFPERIPEALFKGNKHDKPLPGQGNDIVFELMVIPEKYIIRKTDSTKK